MAEDLSKSDREELARSKDYASLKKLDTYAPHFRAGNFIEPPTFEALKASRAGHTKNESNVVPLWKHPLWRVAAAVLILLAGYITFFHEAGTEVRTKIGEKTLVTLPDDSEVYLNSVSEISYNPGQWNDKRSLSLNGEAYFKVAKGSRFSVHTPEGVVSVLGTQFNVKYRPHFFQVVCYQGRVGVDGPHGQVTLTPGVALNIIEGKVKTDTIKAPEPDWIKNISTFDNVPFGMVISELERQYGISIKAPGVDMSRLFNGGFDQNNLEEALKAITRPFGLEYSIESPNRVVLKQSESQ